MYFNPITYFFKSFIRVFTRKFFWVLLILLMIIIGWVLYDKGVFAESIYTLNTSHDYNINGARSQVGDEIWNNPDYDIFIFYRTAWWNNVVYYYNAKNFIDTYGDYGYVMNNPSNYDSTYKASAFTLRPDSDPDNFNYLVPSDVVGREIGGSRTTTIINPAVIGSSNSVLLLPIRSHFDIYDRFGDLIYSKNASSFTEPSFTTTESDISTWNFTNLEISGGDVPYYTAMPGGTLEDQTTYIELDVEYNYTNYIVGNNNQGGLLNQFITIDEDTALWTMSIPSNYLTNYFNVENGGNIKFTLFVEQQNPFEQYTIETNDITFNLTAEQIAKINGDSDKQIQGTIINQQQQIVEGQQQLQNTITDTTIPADAEFDLPTIDVNDSTANFFDTLFTGIYNAFNTSEDTSISFTIFSKTITINSADFRMLNDSRFTILRNLLESSWYFAIGYMILKDIRHIFDKIKTGNIENAVSNDIKADMV